MQLTNLKEELADGKVLSLLIHRLVCVIVEDKLFNGAVNDNLDPVSRLTSAFTDAEAHFGVSMVQNGERKKNKAFFGLVQSCRSRGEKKKPGITECPES